MPSEFAIHQFIVLPAKALNFLGHRLGWLVPIVLLALSLGKIWQGLYPLPTSWLPAEIGLAKFIEHWGWRQDWYPYWYLGTYFRWTTGPLIPGLLIITKFAFTEFFSSEIDWFRAGLVLETFSLVLGTLGSYFLGRKVFGNSTSGLLTALLFSFSPGFFWVFPQVWKLPWGVFVPWRIVGSYAVGNLSTFVAASFLPWALWITIKLLLANSSSFSPLQTFLFALVVLVLILTHLSFLLSFLVLLFLFLLVTHQPSSVWQSITWAVALGWVSSFFWYPPSFWLHLVASPSFGGQPLWQVVWFVVRYVGTLLAIGWSFARWKKLSSFSWGVRWAAAATALFIALTLVRFLKDPDFWMDYTAWGTELELVVALLAAGLILRLTPILRRVVFVAILSLAIFQCWRIFNLSDKLTSHQLGSAESQVVRWAQTYPSSSQRIFTSGTPVAWISSLDSLAQLRGGRDLSAVHPFWAIAAYQIREGESGILAHYWLTALGISHLVVHQSRSSEFWHDFPYPNKFDQPSFRQLTTSLGDSWYQIPRASLARIGSLGLVHLDSPQDGIDAARLEDYLAELGENLPATWSNPDSLVINNASKASLISVAVTHDGGWQALASTGEPLPIQKDALGNVLITNQAQNPQVFLARKNSLINFNWWWPIIGLAGCLLGRPLLAPLASKLPSLNLGLGLDESDEEY